MQAALTMPERRRRPRPSRLAWNRHSARGRSTSRPTSPAPRAAPFLVTETNALSIGESHANFPAYDGQWRQAAWSLVARGARMV